MTQTEQSRAASVVRSLAEGDPAAEVDARALILSGGGTSLFQAFKEEHPNLNDAMRILETRFDLHPFSTTYLFSHLAFWAARKKNAAVFDGVDLWMHHKGPVEVRQALEVLLEEPIRSRSKKRIRLWIEQQLSSGGK